MTQSDPVWIQLIVALAKPLLLSADRPDSVWTRAFNPHGSLTPSLLFRAEGSVIADNSAEFTFGNRKINLKSLGDSFVISFHGVPPTADEFLGADTLSVPFSGAVQATEHFQEQVTITLGSGGFGPPR